MTGNFPQTGKLFAEKYRIEELLGSGGFARVYLAEQIDLGRQVAIKVLNLELPGQPDEEDAPEVDPQIESIALRFEREARVISQLRRPQTITIYDYGRTDDGMVYMVMEYIDGLELGDMPVPIEPRRVLKILRQVLLSLQEAHASGLLHRDIKPANIMLYTHLGQTDQVKLLDFGIAKVIGEASSDAGADLTRADSLIGTPRYMSPEQIRGEEIGPASDIYSLGLVVYELLVGAKAITNTDSIEILGQHLTPESFHIPANKRLHPELTRVVNKMLAKNTSERYASTDEVLADLDALDELDGDLRVSGPPSLNAPTRILDGSDIQELDPSYIRPYDPTDEGLDGITLFEERALGLSNKRRAALIALLLLLACTTGALIWWKSAPADTPDELAAQPEEEPRAQENSPLREEDPSADERAEIDELAQKSPDSQLPLITLIRTRPSGASVWIEERLMGMSPVQFNADDYEFPIKVRAQLGEHTLEKTLKTPGGEIWLDIPTPEQNLTNKAEEKKSAPRPKPTPPRPAAPPKPKPKPKKAPANAEKPAEPAKNKPAETEPADKPSTPSEPSGTRKYLPLD